MPAVIEGVNELQERVFPSCSRRGTPCPGNSFTPSGWSVPDNVSVFIITKWGVYIKAADSGNSHVRTVNPSFVRTPSPEMEMFWPMTVRVDTTHLSQEQILQWLDLDCKADDRILDSNRLRKKCSEKANCTAAAVYRRLQTAATATRYLIQALQKVAVPADSPPREAS